HITVGAVRDDCENIVQAGGAHVRWFENRLTHVVVIGLTGGALDHTSEENVAVAGVLHFGAGLELKRIGGKLAERLVDAVVVARVDALGIIPVVANTALMRKQLPRGYRPLLARKRGAV